MTQRQVLKKCEIAKKKGEAVLPDGDIIRYYDTTQEYALISSADRVHHTICVTYKPEFIAELCAY